MNMKIALAALSLAVAMPAYALLPKDCLTDGRILTMRGTVVEKHFTDDEQGRLFKVPHMGSVNPSPLGDRDAILPKCRIISAAVTRSGTASTIWFGSRNTGIRFWLETLDSAHVSCCGR